MRRLFLAALLFAAPTFAADTKISALPDGSPALGTDLLPAARAGANVRLPISDFCRVNNCTMTAPVLGASGCTNPPFSFSDDTDNGMCRLAPDIFRLQTGTTTSNAYVALTGAANNAKLELVAFGATSNSQWGFTVRGIDTTGQTDVWGGTVTSPVVSFFADRFFTLKPIEMEGTSADSSELTLTTNPTADRTITFPDQTGNAQIYQVGTAAPTGTDCDAAVEVGRLYQRSDALTSNPSQFFRCAQTAASAWAWVRVGYGTGTSAPSPCEVGDLFFDTDATAGSNWFGCTATDTWTLMSGGGGGGFTSPGTGIIVDVGGGTLDNRTITAGAGLTVTNGNGASGEPTVAADRSTVPFKGLDAGPPPAACGDTGDSFQLNDIFLDTSTDIVYVCDDIDHWTQINGGAGGADIATTFSMTEEFTTGTITSGGIGAHGLTFSALSTGTIASFAPTTAQSVHPGLLRMSSHATNDNSGVIMAISNFNSAFTFGGWNTQDWDLDGIVRINTVANSAFYFGLQDTNNTAPTNAIGILRDTDLSHTAFIVKVCDSGTSGCQSAGDDTNQDSHASTITPTNALWVRLRLSFSNSLQRLSARVNDETAVTFCASGCDSTIANYPTVALAPAVWFVTRTTTGVVSADVDVISLRITFSGARY